MSVAKIAISIDHDLLKKIDQLVSHADFRSRSELIQEAIEAKIISLDQYALSRECEKLDIKAEQRMAEEGFSGDLTEWPEF